MLPDHYGNLVPYDTVAPGEEGFLGASGKISRYSLWTWTGVAYEPCLEILHLNALRASLGLEALE